MKVKKKLQCYFFLQIFENMSYIRNFMDPSPVKDPFFWGGQAFLRWGMPPLIRLGGPAPLAPLSCAPDCMHRKSGRLVYEYGLEALGGRGFPPSTYLQNLASPEGRLSGDGVAVFCRVYFCII